MKKLDTPRPLRVALHTVRPLSAPQLAPVVGGSAGIDPGMGHVSVGVRPPPPTKS
jgi:hypothetical protein